MIRGDIWLAWWRGKGAHRYGDPVTQGGIGLPWGRGEGGQGEVHLLMKCCRHSKTFVMTNFRRFIHTVFAFSILFIVLSIVVMTVFLV